MKKTNKQEKNKTGGDAPVTTSALTRHIRGHFLGKLMQIYSSYGSEERPPPGGRGGGRVGGGGQNDKQETCHQGKKEKRE